MPNSILINGVKVEYEEAIRNDIRNTYLKFNEDMLMLVSRKRIRDPHGLILRHKSWVLRHYQQVNMRIRLFAQNSILFHGTQFNVERQLYMGRPSVLVNSENSTIVVKAHDDKSAKLALLRYIKKSTLEYATTQAHKKAGAIGRKIRTVKVRKTKRWGACNSKHILSFNSCISMLPNDISDYIISHEVAHLSELNHSRRFWNIVSGFNPNYRQLRKELHNYDSSERLVFENEKANAELDYV